MPREWLTPQPDSHTVLVRRAKKESFSLAIGMRDKAGWTQPQLFENLEKQSYLPGEPGAAAQL